MHHYRICAGNPEETDFVLDVDHEKEFSSDEFDAIAEAAILYALETDYKTDGHAFVSSINTDHVIKFLEQKGFIPPAKLTGLYYMDPYWNKDRIKCDKIRQWIDKPLMEDAPQYIKDGAGEQQTTGQGMPVNQ